MKERGNSRSRENTHVLESETERTQGREGQRGGRAERRERAFV